MYSSIVNKIINYFIGFLCEDNNGFKIINYKDDIEGIITEYKLINFTIFNKTELKYIYDNVDKKNIGIEIQHINTKINNIPYMLIINLRIVLNSKLENNNIPFIITNPQYELFKKLENKKKIISINILSHEISLFINKFLIFSYLQALSLFNSYDDIVTHITPVIKFISNNNDDYLFYFYELENILPDEYLLYFDSKRQKIVNARDAVYVSSNIKFANDKLIKSISNIQLNYDLVFKFYDIKKRIDHYFKFHYLTNELSLNNKDNIFLNKIKNSFLIKL